MHCHRIHLVWRKLGSYLDKQAFFLIRPIVRYVPVKVILAKQLSLSRKTFVGECAFAVVAMDAFDVPNAVQNFQQEFIRDGELASRALLNHVTNLALHPADRTRTSVQFPRPLATVCTFM